MYIIVIDVLIHACSQYPLIMYLAKYPIHFRLSSFVAANQIELLNLCG